MLRTLHLTNSEDTPHGRIFQKIPDTSFRGLNAQYLTFYGFSPNKPNLYPKISVLDEKSMKNLMMFQV